MASCPKCGKPKIRKRRGKRSCLSCGSLPIVGTPLHLSRAHPAICEDDDMLQMILKLEGDDAWPDLLHKQFIHLGSDAPPMQVAVLDGGMASGQPSVGIRLDLPDGQTIVAETSARLFVCAARAIEAKFPDLFKD